MNELDTLISWVNPFASQKHVTSSQFRDLVRLVGRYIFQSHTSLPHGVPLQPDSNLTLTCLPQLEKVHLMFEHMLTYYSHYVTTAINPCFMRKLVKQLSTPVSVERRAIERAIAAIARISPRFSHLIHTMVLARVSESVYDNRAVIGLQSMLHLLCPLLENGMCGCVFRRSIVPLYGLRSYPMYAAELSRITSCFANWRPEDADYCLGYLLAHWPVTNSRKEVLFLNEVRELQPHLTAKGHATLWRSLMARVGKSLLSRHARVAEAAARVLHRESDDSAIHPRKKGPIPEVLVKAIEGAREHWNREVRKYAASISRLLEDGPTAAHRSEAHRSRGWACVLNKAMIVHKDDAPEISGSLPK
jgi:hypothetical protein